MTRSAAFASLVLAALAAGCTDQTPLPLAPEGGQVLTSSSTDTDPRAIWEYHSSFTDVAGVARTARIFGDGRTATGEASSTGISTYQGDVCGVHAKIFVANGGGDAVLDPDGNYQRGMCGGKARFLQFNLGSSTVKAGAFTNALRVWHLEAGQATQQRMNYRYTGISKCELLVFEDANGSSPVRVERLPDTGSGARQWRVESVPNGQGKHVAGCHNWVKGGYQYTGPSYEMPFSAVITEVK